MPTLLSPEGTRDGGIRARYSKGIVNREEDHHFFVKADSLTQLRTDIIYSTAGLPIPGQTIFNGMLCIGSDAVRTKENGLVLDVTCTFSTEVEGIDPENPATSGPLAGDPVLWIPVRQTLHERAEEYFLTDVDGSLITNSYGDFYENGIIRARWLLSWDFVQFDRISVKDEDLMEWNEVVNKTEWKGKPAKTWLCRVLDSEVGFYAGHACRKTIFRVTYNNRTWRVRRVDMGWRFLNADGEEELFSVKTRFHMGPLDGTGHAAASPAAAAVRKFDQFESIEFKDFLRV